MDTLELVLNKKVKGVATGFKRAYSNGDGTYTVEFIDGTKVTTNFIKGDKGDIGVGVADVIDNGDGTFKLKLDDGTETSNIATVQGIQGVQGERGVNGIGIVDFKKQGTTGLVDTYIITLSDGSQYPLEVTNGANVTKTSQLTNDNNFVDRLVTNLVNYYSKAEVYTKEQIDELMRNVGAGLGIAIVDVLPSSDISTTTIYLVANGDNNYIQYMYIADSWANLGSTTVDLTNYYTKEQIDNLFLGYVTSEVFQTALADYAKIEALGKVAFSNSYNDLDDLPEIPSTEGFMKGRQVLGEVDLNDCVTEGTFTVTATSANLPNIPIYGTYVDLQVLSIETVVSQIVRLIYNGEPMMWSRCKIIDTWTEWVHAISSDMCVNTIEDNSKSIPTSKAVHDALSKSKAYDEVINVDEAQINIKGWCNNLTGTLPDGITAGWFNNEYVNDATVNQKIITYTKEIYVRSKFGGVWSKWQEVSLVEKPHYSNPNLLDNPWFSVNQRGFTSKTLSGTAEYFADRWASSRSAITLNSDHSVDFAWNGTSGTNAWVEQWLEKETLVVGNTYTLSAIIDEQLFSATGVLTSGGGIRVDKLWDNNSNNRLSVGYNSTKDAWEIAIWTVSTTPHKIQKVKLELGSTSTLANDVAPNYATELIKCQRFYQTGGVYGSTRNNGWITANLPVPLRISNPQITFTPRYFFMNENDGTELTEEISNAIIGSARITDRYFVIQNQFINGYASFGGDYIINADL